MIALLNKAKGQWRNNYCRSELGLKDSKGNYGEELGERGEHGELTTVWEDDREPMCL